ncbi:MAG TPA: hypothetical protein VNJ01_14995 [Bacteriovoracaceae bacterium]|nr:hypothetical protein [Bacteriovoracaceae bacterium]
MKPIILMFILFSNLAFAFTVPVQVSVKTSVGEHHTWNSEIGDVGSAENKFTFISADKSFHLKIAHRKWPEGRSYPGRLDIYLETADGIKIGGGFFSINGKEHLTRFPQLGFAVRFIDKLFTISISSLADLSGHLMLSSVSNEILLLDVVSNPLNGFQMVRPVSLKLISPEIASSKFFQLDEHPFQVQYRAVQSKMGHVMFYFDLYTLQGNVLLHSSFYESTSSEDFTSAMFAGRYFVTGHDFKLIYYPAKGQQHAKN